VAGAAARAGLGRGAVRPAALGVRGGVTGSRAFRVFLILLIDAETYHDQKLLVVGGGDSAVEAAIGLARQPGNEVTLSYRREKLVRIKKKNEDRLAPLLASGRIRTAFGSQVVEIAPDRVRLKTGDEVRDLPNDYVFVFAGGEPPFDFLKACGVRFGGEAAIA
jgi:thioredoxin reductase (NADPH)